MTLAAATPGVRPAPRPEPPKPPALFVCPACRRVQQRRAEALRPCAPNDVPSCCGRAMVPVLPAAEDPDPAAAADPWADRRAGERRPARRGARLEVRLGGRGPDLAVALLDVSAGGLGAAVRDGLSVGDRVVVWAAPPGYRWVYQGTAVVCWRAAGAEGTAQVGLRLRSPLPADAAADLAEPDSG